MIQHQTLPAQLLPIYDQRVPDLNFDDETSFNIPCDRDTGEDLTSFLNANSSSIPAQIDGEQLATLRHTPLQPDDNQNALLDSDFSAGHCDLPLGFDSLPLFSTYANPFQRQRHALLNAQQQSEVESQNHLQAHQLLQAHYQEQLERQQQKHRQQQRANSSRRPQHHQKQQNSQCHKSPYDRQESPRPQKRHACDQEVQGNMVSDAYGQGQGVAATANSALPALPTRPALSLWSSDTETTPFRMAPLSAPTSLISSCSLPSSKVSNDSRSESRSGTGTTTAGHMTDPTNLWMLSQPGSSSTSSSSSVARNRSTRMHASSEEEEEDDDDDEEEQDDEEGDDFDQDDDLEHHISTQGYPCPLTLTTSSPSRSGPSGPPEPLSIFPMPTPTPLPDVTTAQSAIELLTIACDAHSPTHTTSNMMSSQSLLAATDPVVLRRRPDIRLTKVEERELKKLRRRFKNKLSAAESRKRKKVYMSELEARVRGATVLNQNLRTRLALLEAKNRALTEQLRQKNS